MHKFIIYFIPVASMMNENHHNSYHPPTAHDQLCDIFIQPHLDDEDSREAAHHIAVVGAIAISYNNKN